jgi:pimeloyl-ACP methyl ester carboxylesterase
VAATTANGITLEYETIGDPASEPVVLLAGAGGQLIHFPDEFCDLLADLGYFVIRLDYRDLGLSEKLHGVAPTTVEELLAVQRGEATAPYTLDDVADDVAALLSALGVSAAHVVGVSMGAAVGRKLTLRHPGVVCSLVLTITGSPTPGLPAPKPELRAVMGAVLTIDDREAWIENQAEGWRALSGGHGTYDEEHVRRLAAVAFERGLYPQGLLRQQAAVAASRASASEELPRLRVPTLVIQGSHDPFYAIEHGEDLVRLIPDAELVVMQNLGHEFPPHAFRAIAEVIAAHAKKISTAVGGA